MTVQELIQKLSTLDPNIQVIVRYSKDGLDVASHNAVAIT